MQSILVEMAVKTNVGKVREMNEDNFIMSSDLGADKWFISPDQIRINDNGVLMAVADGMGGANAGEVASRICIEAIQSFIRDRISKGSVTHDDISLILRESIVFAHESIVKYSKVNIGTQGMGTTIVVVWVRNDYAYFAWSGDSRGYIFGNHRGLVQVTKDHSYVQSLVDQGKITPDQAIHHPQSNVILQSLGDPERYPEPDSMIIKFNQGDVILLCSDGLNSMLEDSVIESILVNDDFKPSIFVNDLIEASNEAGGFDNITVAALRVIEGVGENIANDLSTNHTIPSAGKLNKNNNLLILFAILAIAIAGGAIFFSLNSKRVVDKPSEVEAIAKDTTVLPNEVPPTLERNDIGIPHSSERGTDHIKVEKNHPNNKKDINAIIKTQVKSEEINDVTPIIPSDKYGDEPEVEIRKEIKDKNNIPKDINSKSNKMDPEELQKIENKSNKKNNPTNSPNNSDVKQGGN
jgi:PPM family protein phosphatase